MFNYLLCLYYIKSHSGVYPISHRGNGGFFTKVHRASASFASVNTSFASKINEQRIIN
jgi:hypothetical protein